MFEKLYQLKNIYHN